MVKCWLLAPACLLLLVVTQVVLVHSAPVCPSGWVAFRESCYLFSKDFLTWFQAAAECRKHGAHLVTVDDDIENKFLSNYILNPALAMYFGVNGKRSNDNWPYGDFSVTWIGLNDLYVEGTWRWVDTDSAASFRTWDNGQPDNARGNENCVHYGLRSTVWNDLGCNFYGTYICEI